MSFGIITRSLALWVTVGSLLWGYLGLLVASRTRLPLVVGFFAGAITWFVGVAVLLLVGTLRHSPSVSSATPVAGRPRVGSAGANAPIQEPRSWVGFDDPETDAGPVRAVASSGSTDPCRRPTSFGQLACVVIAATSGMLMLTSTFVSWGRWRIAWSGRSQISGGAAPSDLLPAAIVISASGVLVIVAGVETWRKPRALWLAVGAVIGAWWFTATVQALIVEDEAHALGRIADTADGGRLSATLSTGDGVWLMLVACVGLLSWAVLGAAVLITGERSTSVGCPAPIAESSGSWSFQAGSGRGFDV